MKTSLNSNHIQEFIPIERRFLVEMVLKYGHSSDRNYTNLMKVIDNDLDHFYCWEATNEELRYYLNNISQKDIIKLIKKTFA